MPASAGPASDFFDGCHIVVGLVAGDGNIEPSTGSAIRNRPPDSAAAGL